MDAGSGRAGRAGRREPVGPVLRSEDGPDAASAEGGGVVVGALGAGVFRWGRACAAAVVTALVIGVPTDILANPWFTREIPVRWWEYPILGLTCLLTAAWFGIRTGSPENENSGRPGAYGGAALALFAVGCPVCNKVVLLAIGTSGALGFWQPIQPYLAAVSLLLLAAAVAYRWRRRDCGPACSV